MYKLEELKETMNAWFNGEFEDLGFDKDAALAMLMATHKTNIEYIRNLEGHCEELKDKLWEERCKSFPKDGGFVTKIIQELEEEVHQLRSKLQPM